MKYCRILRWVLKSSRRRAEDSVLLHRNVVFMIDMERFVNHSAICLLYLVHPQEGLKAHEGGRGHANPFDVFSSFFGGGRK